MPLLSQRSVDTHPGLSLGQDNDNRRQQRVTSPRLCVGIRGREYITVNWSLEGILIEGYEGILGVGDTFEIDTLQFGESPAWPVMMQARVVRRDGHGESNLAAQFKVLNTLAFDILEAIILRRTNLPDAA